MKTTGNRGIYLVCALALLFGMLQGIPVCQAIAEQTGNGATGVYVKGPLLGDADEGDADDQKDDCSTDELCASADNSVSETATASVPLPQTGDGVIGAALVVCGALFIVGVILIVLARAKRNR